MSSKTEHGTLPTKQQEIVEQQQEEQLKEAQSIATPEGQAVPASTPPPGDLEHPPIKSMPSGKLPAEKTEVM